MALCLCSRAEVKSMRERERRVEDGYIINMHMLTDVE